MEAEDVAVVGGAALRAREDGVGFREEGESLGCRGVVRVHVRVMGLGEAIERPVGRGGRDKFSKLHHHSLPRLREGKGKGKWV